MQWLKKFRGGARREDEIEAELAHHLEMKQRELEREGMPAEEARFTARRSLGNVGRWRERTGELWRFVWLESLWSDIAFSARLLGKEKVFTAVAVVTLALGIGANTAIFSLMNGLFWRPLPVEHPEELASVAVTNLPPGFKQWVNGVLLKTNQRREMTFAMYEALAKRQQIFSGIFGETGFGWMRLESQGVAHRAAVAPVTGSYFPVLEVTPQRGRTLTEADDVPGGASSGWQAVISDRLWSELFGRSAEAIGARISIESVPFRICGIAPASFKGITPGRHTDVWIPLSALEAIYPKFDWRTNRSEMWVIRVTARLKEGVTMEQAREHLAAIAPAVLEAAKDPQLTGKDEKDFVAMRFAPASASSGESWLTVSYGEALWVLLAAVGAVLLIAVTNLTNLFLARTAARRGEMAVRMSLGAPAWRIRRQLLVESALLALAGGLAGLAWTRWLIALFEAGVSPGGAVDIDTSIDWRIFLFLAATLILVILVAGLAPAFTATGAGAQEVLKTRSGGARSFALRRGLIVLQTALSLALMAGAGLMIASIRDLLHDSTGFQAENSAFFTPDLYNAGIGRERMARAYESLLGSIRQQPNVISAAWTSTVPLTGSFRNESIEIPGRPDLTIDQRIVYLHYVSDGYFNSVGLPLLAGSDLPPAGSPRANLCVLSERAAQRFFGSAGQAVGKRVNDGKVWWEVAGVAGDAKYLNVREAPPSTMYLPYWSGNVNAGMTVAVRYRGSLNAIFSALQFLFQKEAGRLPYTEVRTIRGNIGEAISPERLLAFLLGGFAGFALLISAVGLAGLLSYVVEQRQKELGIRLALGATPGRIQRQVQWEGLLLVTSGMAGGAVLAYVLRKSLNSFLYGVAAADPLIWAAAIAALLAAAMAATGVPAARAAKVDPAVMLRQE